MAKNPKYMMAAGCDCLSLSSGGMERSTDWRLFIPMMTSSRRTAIIKTVLKMSFAFMVRGRVGDGPFERKRELGCQLKS